MLFTETVHYYLPKLYITIYQLSYIAIYRLHYYDIGLKSLTNIEVWLKSPINTEVYKKYSNKIKSILNYNNENKFKRDDWFDYIRNHNIFHEGEHEFGVSTKALFSSKNLTESVLYWAEFKIYDDLTCKTVNCLKDDEYCKENFEYTIEELYIDRSDLEIFRDKKYLVTKDDYRIWCLEVWKDIEDRNKELSDNDYLPDEYYETGANSRSYKSEYPGAPDGYGGTLNDDFINDALGGESDTIWNID